MTSQLVVRIDGYPDEVVVAGTSINVGYDTPTLAASVMVTRVSALVESVMVSAELGDLAVSAEIESETVVADVESLEVDVDFCGAVILPEP